MPLIIGLDPSIRKAGYCVIDTDAPPFTFVERGRLYTTVADGIPIQRFLKQQKQIRELIERHSVAFIAMEAPYFGDGESERLYALNQFLHSVFLDLGTFVIVFPPQQLKKLSIPDKNVEDVHKAQMVADAKQKYGLLGKPLTDDEADALHAGRLGWLFYNWHFKKSIASEDLHPLVWKAFDGRKVYKKGIRKGIEIRTGLIYRENELFFDFKRVKERKCKIVALPEDLES